MERELGNDSGTNGGDAVIPQSAESQLDLFSGVPVFPVNKTIAASQFTKDRVLPIVSIDPVRDGLPHDSTTIPHPDVALPEAISPARIQEFLNGVRNRPIQAPETQKPNEAPEQKESRELADKHLKPALGAIKAGDFKRLCEIAASLQTHPGALGNLEKLLSEEAGVTVAFENGAMEVTLSSRFQEPGRKHRTTTTHLTYDADGRPIRGGQTIADRRGVLELKPIDLKKADLELSFKVGRVIKGLRQ